MGNTRQALTRLLRLAGCAALFLAAILPHCRAVAQAVITETTGHSQAVHAVVRLPSHGASATVICTLPGQTWILGCAHAFQGRDRNKPIALDAPSPQPGQPRRAGVHLVACDYDADLTLCVLDEGPLPYVAPVAPPGFRPGPHVESVGYDEMKLPPQVRHATILGYSSGITWTREKPWHGRSGGGLIDADAGVLIGVVQGYEVGGESRGMYVSHDTIVRFLQSYEAGHGQRPQQDYRQPSPRRRMAQPQCPS